MGNGALNGLVRPPATSHTVILGREGRIPGSLIAVILRQHKPPSIFGASVRQMPRAPISAKPFLVKCLGIYEADFNADQ